MTLFIPYNKNEMFISKTTICRLTSSWRKDRRINKMELTKYYKISSDSLEKKFQMVLLDWSNS